MARAATTPLVPYFVVTLSAAAVTAGAMTYMVRTTSDIAGSAEVNAANFKSRYVAAALAHATAADLDIARSVPVTPSAAMVPIAADTLPAPASGPATEVASVE